MLCNGHILEILDLKYFFWNDGKKENWNQQQRAHMPQEERWNFNLVGV
jgi:hypothetical protein